MTVWWLSSPRMTVTVKTDKWTEIVDAAPIVRKFVGQHLNDLVRWMKKQGKVDMVRIS